MRAFGAGLVVFRLFSSTLLIALTFILPLSVQAETLRIAQFNAALGRDGPGLLLKDILSGEDQQVKGIAGIIRHIDPDILLINEFDYDANLVALSAFVDLLREGGTDYPYMFALPVNSGVPSGVDLNMDGRTNDREDAYGFGRFSGHKGMAILSRYPIEAENARSFQNLLWRDLPGANLPQNDDGSPFFDEAALDVLRLSSRSHWDVPINIGGTTLHLLASHPTPPVFDGVEDMNGWRNHDEILFWKHYIEGVAFRDDRGETFAFEAPNFVLAGTLNADPVDGDGRQSAIKALLDHPRIQDPKPSSTGAEQSVSGGSHLANPAYDTTNWPDEDGPGNLRADYILPSSNLDVLRSGGFWPSDDTPEAALLKSDAELHSDHILVWVELNL